MLGRDYVLLRHFDGEHRVRRVYWMGGLPFAFPYSKDTGTRLLPEGKVDGPSYVKAWRPITRATQDWFVRDVVAAQ